MRVGGGLAQGVEGRRAVGPGDDNRDHCLTPGGVRYPGDDHLANAADPDQHRFHDSGVDLDPAGDDDVIDPPDHLFSDTATLDLGGREIRLAYLGRAHTDNDIVVHVPDADALCAGDLVENGATPYFGDGYPMDWPETAEALLSMMGADTVVIPGHGDHAGRAFVEDSLVAFRANAALARRVHAGELDLEAAFSLSPFPPATAREPLGRAVAQLQGELDELGEPADQPLTTTPKP